MREHDYARLLTEQIEDLDTEIKALIPDWQGAQPAALLHRI